MTSERTKRIDDETFLQIRRAVKVNLRRSDGKSIQDLVNSIRVSAMFVGVNVNDYQIHRVIMGMVDDGSINLTMKREGRQNA